MPRQHDFISNNLFFVFPLGLQSDIPVSPHNGLTESLYDDITESQSVHIEQSKSLRTRMLT